MKLLFAVALVASFAACTQPRSARCKTVCAREAECLSSTNSAVPFDEKECVASCSMLEQDQANLAQVERHAECVMKQAACTAVVACQ